MSVSGSTGKHRPLDDRVADHGRSQSRETTLDTFIAIGVSTAKVVRDLERMINDSGREG